MKRIAPSSAAPSNCQRPRYIRDRLNSHLTAVGEGFKEDEGIDLNPFIDAVTKEITEKCPGGPK